jgi:hypothetical protein
MSILIDRARSYPTLSFPTVVCSSNRRSECVSGETTKMRTTPDIAKIGVYDVVNKVVLDFRIEGKRVLWNVAREVWIEFKFVF